MRQVISFGVALVLVVGCGGVSRIGEGKGNVDGAGGDPGASAGGAASGSGGAKGSECQADNECGAPELCRTCPDGSSACPRGMCQGGSCEVVYPACGGEPACRVADDCPQPPPSCNVCPDGSYDCPAAECTGGVCSISSRGCESQLECRSAADCGLPELPCPICPDGSSACPTAECAAGMCQVREGTCGGGSCDPAFCGGNETGPGCCIGPNGPCGIDTGNGCGRVGDACVTDLDCPVLDAECVPCADGSCTPPKSYCSAGQCLTIFPSCVPVTHWYATCGDPACAEPGAPRPGQDAAIPPPWPMVCDTRSGQSVGAGCDPSMVGVMCDAGLGCGALLVCATSDPAAAPGGCPR